MATVRPPDRPDADRDLDHTDGVSVGHNQIRIDLDVAGAGWRETLLRVLEAGAYTAD